ncbi:hypothetical protein [Arthrobacter globiformis]|uniref:hypothetical protein n=1 Tax=Arthrobacter globiformis TaxID=1665 RepID=UPI00278762DC|nr:hypothetical protein [Arthrobacter globiformis]MDQ0864290.1 hypothetical protein [Arthrobacter globiformis]
MDPIKNLISGSDPLRNDHAEMPDADAALRRVTSEAPMFTDSLPANVLRFEDRKRRRARVAGVLTLAAAAVTAGVLVATNFGALTSAPAPAGPVAPTSSETTAAAPAKPAATPKPTATRTAAATAPAAPKPAPVTWTTFTDATGQATFEHPLGWRVSQTPQTIDGGAYNIVEVKNAAGRTMATLRLVYDVTGGPVCPAPKPYQTLDSVVVDIPQKPAKLREHPQGPSAFVFRVIQGDKVYGSLALADGDLAPQPTTCGLYNGILGPDNVPFAHFGDTVWLTSDGQGAPLTFDSVAEAKTYMATQEYRDVKRMLISLALKPANTATSPRFVSQDGKASFVLPEGWTAKDVQVGTPENPGSGITVSDEAGKTVASFQHVAAGGLGGACTDGNYKITELDSGASSLTANWAVARGVRFSYRVMDNSPLGKGFSYQLGLVDKDSGSVSDSCLMYTLVTGTPRGILSFADRAVQEAAEPTFTTVAEARAYMETSEYKKLKAMIQSLEVTS